MATGALGPGRALLTLPSPPRWPPPGSPPPQPRGAGWGVFLPALGFLSVRDRVAPSHSPVSARHSLGSARLGLAVESCGFAAWDGLRPGQMSTCEERPARTDRPPGPTAPSRSWVLSPEKSAESKFLGRARASHRSPRCRAGSRASAWGRGAPGDRAGRVSDPRCWVCPLDLAGRLILGNVPRFRWSVAELRVS